MSEDLEQRYRFSISVPGNIDFVCSYLKGLKLEERDYVCLKNVGIILASLTLGQAKGLKEDMGCYIDEIKVGDDDLIAQESSKTKKLLESIVFKR